MNNIQWADGGELKLPKTDQDLMKLKPFTDLTSATGDAIKDSIAANNKLTQQIIKNIDIGQKQREANIDTLTKWAPKAAGQIYEVSQNIRTNRKWLGEMYNVEKLQKENKSYQELERIIGTRSGKISGILEGEGNIDEALDALGLEDNAGRKDLLNAYWTNIRDSVYKSAGQLEFEIDGKKHTLSSAGAVQAAEIRKRIDVAIAAHAYGEGDVFGKREILNGILLKSAEENQKLFIADLAAERAQKEKELFVEKHNVLMTRIKNNETTAFSEFLTSEHALHNTLKEKGVLPDEASFLQKVIGRKETLLEAARLGPENGGLSVTQVRNQFLNSGPVTWADGTKYKNIVEAYDAQHAGLGSQWMKELDEIEGDQITKTETDRNNAIKAKSHELRSALNNAKTDAEYTEIVKNYQETVFNEDSIPGYNISLLPADIKNTLQNPEINLITAEEKYNNIVALYEARKPVPPSLINELPVFIQNRLNERYGGAMWSSTDQTEITNNLQETGLLQSPALMVAFGGLSAQGLENRKGWLLEEMNHEIAVEYNKLIGTTDHTKALTESQKIVEERYRDIITKGTASNASDTDRENLKKLIQLKAQRGIGIDGARTPAQLTAHLNEVNSFVNDVVANNTKSNNVSIFSSNELLVGEDQKEQDQLRDWIQNGASGPLPNFYAALSRSSKIPKHRIALLRAKALGIKLHGGETGSDRENIWIENIKKAEEKVNKAHPATEALVSARTNGEANLILLNKGLAKDPTFVEGLFHDTAVAFSEGNEGLTPYDSIQNIDDADYKSEKPLTKMNMGEISTFLETGKYFNIGAFGIPNEQEFGVVATRLNQLGLIDENTIFNKETQLLFHTQAAIIKSQRLQAANGVTFEQTTLSEADLSNCGLDKNDYPVNADICKIIHDSYLKKNKK